MLVSEMFEADFETAPIEEECGQSGFEFGTECQSIEAQVIKGQIEREFGPLPEGASLRKKGVSYENFMYYEMVYKCPYEDEKAVEYGYKLEAGWPLKWDEESKRQLGELGYWEKLATNQKRVRI